MENDQDLIKVEKKPKSELSKKEARQKLWELGNLEYFLKGKQKDIAKFIKNIKDDTGVVLASRRLGKCFADSFYITTPNGVKKVSELNVGDYVLGYNKDGSISPTRITAKEYMGDKTVVDYVNNGRVLCTATPEHRWLAVDPRYPDNFREESGEKIGKSSYLYIVKKQVEFNKPGKSIPYAYALGALLGDGCSKQQPSVLGSGVVISSADLSVVEKTASQLGLIYKKNGGKNYNWTLEIANQPARQKKVKVPSFEFYDQWCKGRYAHEKYIDLEEIKTWDSESLKQLLAGLIDTDGSFGVNGRILTMQFCSQSKSFLEAIEWIVYSLVQYRIPIKKDKRTKYVNGPLYQTYLRNNLYTKRLLKILSPYLQCERKKWKDEYENLLENNTNPDYIGIRLKNPRIEPCYDIQVDNETHLYLTGDGLVTHNCLFEDTYVATIAGFKPIKDITTSDYVFGLTPSGRMEYTAVKQVHDQGKQAVVDIYNTNTNRLVAKCTLDHKWLAHNKITKEREVVTTQELLAGKHQLVNKVIFENYIDIHIKDEGEVVQTYDIGIDNGTHLYMIQGGYITHNSFVLCTLAVETCIKKGNAVVKYACPQKDQVQKAINHNIELIIKDAPLSMKPEWKEQRKVWLFPNGSQIQVAGTDKGNAESLRGGYSDLAICDEAGFMDDLDYIVNSILAPTTDTTGGKLILSSTPNYKDPNHEFHLNFIYPFEDSEKLIKFTIYDSPMVDQDKIQKIISRYPKGVDDPKFRCEYLCEVSSTSDATVIPEFTREAQDEIVREPVIPAYRDFYTSCDPAFKDLTAVLFGYYDFKNSTVVILDELAVNGETMTTHSLAKGIFEKESEVYKSPLTKEVFEPYLRIIDNNNLILVNDLNRLHNLQFRPTKKDNKEAQINQLRMMIADRKIIIHPRCVNLIHQLKHIKWSKDGKGFARMKDSAEGYKANHGDACFVENSQVLTSKGYKNIQDIKIGDMVLTHNDRFMPVTNVMKREYFGSMRKVDVAGRPSILCTPEHTFYASKTIRGETPDWVPANQLQNGYTVKIPSPTKRPTFIGVTSSEIELEHPIEVYNLEVLDDNSYTVNDIAVHNCDALIYLIRNISKHKNPFPANFGQLEGPDVYNSKPQEKEHKSLMDMLFNKPKKT